MEEIWKEVVGFEGRYQVSNRGRIRSLKRQNKIRKQSINSKAHYWEISIVVNGSLKTFIAHRWVARAFIPNPENKPQVNHIDGNRLNNCVENLEWNTPRENNLHALATGEN